MFIKATLMKRNSKISINTNHIVSFYEPKNKEGCMIETITNSGDFAHHVKESYQEIDQQYKEYLQYSVPEKKLKEKVSIY